MATIKEMTSQLKDMGVEFPAKSTHAELEAILSDALKAQADANGVDETQSDPGNDQVTKADDEAVNLFTFKNTGKRNYFTEAGRCMPGQTVQLTEEQGAQYPLLEKE